MVGGYGSGSGFMGCSIAGFGFKSYTVSGFTLRSYGSWLLCPLPESLVGRLSSLSHPRHGAGADAGNVEDAGTRSRDSHGLCSYRKPSTHSPQKAPTALRQDHPASAGVPETLNPKPLNHKP